MSWGMEGMISFIVTLLGMIGVVQFAQGINDKYFGVRLPRKEQIAWCSILFVGAAGLYGMGVALIGSILSQFNLPWEKWLVVFILPLILPYFLFIPIAELPEKLSKRLERMKEEKESKDDGLDDLIAASKQQKTEV